MRWERYMGEQIQRIAETGEPGDPDFREWLQVYLALVGRGMTIKAAKRVMDWYVRE